MASAADPNDDKNIAGKMQDIRINSINSDENASAEEPEATDETPFYVEAKKYWSSVPATVNGMLGGYGSISYRDIKASTAFLNVIFKLKPAVGRSVAVDCGAGIGRVSKDLLCPLFRTVDMVEQDENFAKSAKNFLGAIPQLGTIYNVGLQKFSPEERKYDVIWCQWVLSHLTDDDLKKFLERAIVGLNKNGVIVIKENVTSSETEEVDKIDSSVTRPLKVFQEIIRASNLRIIKSVKQTDLPRGLFPIYMIAMRPVKISS